MVSPALRDLGTLGPSVPHPPGKPRISIFPECPNFSTLGRLCISGAYRKNPRLSRTRDATGTPSSTGMLGSPGPPGAPAATASGGPGILQPPLHPVWWSRYRPAPAAAHPVLDFGGEAVGRALVELAAAHGGERSRYRSGERSTGPVPERARAGRGRAGARPPRVDWTGRNVQIRAGAAGSRGGSRTPTLGPGENRRRQEGPGVGGARSRDWSRPGHKGQAHTRPRPHACASLYTGVGIPAHGHALCTHTQHTQHTHTLTHTHPRPTGTTLHTHTHTRLHTHTFTHSRTHTFTRTCLCSPTVMHAPGARVCLPSSPHLTDPHPSPTPSISPCPALRRARVPTEPA